ncbi:hypothetical protein [Actinomyces ruminis]|uniref:Uncharacterized protein n=1 Tax=Actinomyces ruminis TaxID=1937003 RepID=A0ABX4MC78_9ACTO|nr:hypothetical protein [Actinomyces ruminis]PHP53046.1 hypothetical protein BW737_005405 [Actinomyces ruminis]
MTEVQERKRESVRSGSAVSERPMMPTTWYLVASAVIVSLCAVEATIRCQGGDPGLLAVVFLLCLPVLTLGVQPWVHKRSSMRERVVLRMVEGNEAVVLVSLAAVAWFGWGEIPLVLAGVLGAALSLIGLWGLRALRKAAA